MKYRSVLCLLALQMTLSLVHGVESPLVTQPSSITTGRIPIALSTSAQPKENTHATSAIPIVGNAATTVITRVTSTIASASSPPSSGTSVQQSVLSEATSTTNRIMSTDATTAGGISSPPTKKATPSTSTTLTPTAAAAASSTTPTNEFIPQRIQTQLEEKVDLLGCDLPLLPRDSQLWKGNETHELLLPFTIPEECANANDRSTCLPAILSWEGSAEIQSGDVLLVRIDDLHLIQQAQKNHEVITNNTPQEGMMQQPLTAVYQVTRTGHDNCDVTEGILLDITPLKIDDRKVVTLYDKDLTEGINLLIVVSKLWGKQCVRLKVVVKSDNCGENEDCSGKGLCYSNVSMEGYECQCCPGFVGPHCEEQDACYPSPCRNNGICVDITQGHEGATFQCLCPYGYTGKTCEEETDPCTSMPCQNGANCTSTAGNATAFRCECPRGFAGAHCQHNLNECESSPCVHGICVAQEDGYKCFCQPGYTGSLCEYEYNECESSPCINGGTCTDRVGGYSCSCGRGFTGKRCHIKVDLCEPNPCFEPRYCLDKGNNYTCECPKGFSGVDCLLPTRAACSTNPCANGGTCWSSVDSFYCACKAGYTGKTCEDEFVVEKISDVDTVLAKTDDMEIPLGIRLDRIHNVYIAMGTLVTAIVIVITIVTVCHCRVNKTYKRFAMRAKPSWWPSWHGRRVPEVVPTNSEWFSGKDKAPMATPSRSLPALDTTDMYYTLDFSDSQSSPLIQ
ncbi:delta and Notch-like epidermal growth factor-related receptor isoform X2 [Atheta coriaria]|uniref:delta and Notch-like epidermal growth factor-related receptor isoform X2 n=1 Tax=Dalotia coriaria TaxID=877792 RepID=UPI0031F383D9